MISVKLSFSCRYGWSVATPNPATKTGASVNSRARRRVHEEDGGRAVGLRAAVEQVQRMTHGRRLDHVFDRDLVLEVRVRVARAVVVVLHRDRRQHLARRPELVHVAGRERCEQHGRGLAPREDRVAGRGARQQALFARLVAHLLHADDEHDVVDAARDRHGADAKRIGSRRARVLDAGARDAHQTDRGGDRVAADAFLTPERAPLGRDERGLDLRGLEALVDALHRGVEGAGRHLLVALVEELTHLDQSGADDGHLVPAHGSRVTVRRGLPCGRGPCIRTRGRPVRARTSAARGRRECRSRRRCRRRRLAA